MSDEEISSEVTENEASQSSNDSFCDVPNEIDAHAVIVETAFHPHKNVLAVGTIDGPVKIYSYTVNRARSNQNLMTFKHHKESCRAVQFSRAGDFLFSGSSDATIRAIDLNAGAVTRYLTTKRSSAIYCLLSIDNYLLASGDDDGQLIIWDFRKQTPIAVEKFCGEYISSLVSSFDKHMLLAASGEGSLVAFNLRSRKLEMQSQLFDAEFFTAAIMKKETKVMVGAGDGAINIFNWGEWSNISDRFPGHPGSIDTMVRIDDNIICTGCEDGKIRVVQFYPHKVLGVIGNHDTSPIEGLAVSHDSKFIASCSYDTRVKFYDLSGIEKMKASEAVVKKTKMTNFKIDGRNFFAGLA